MKTSEYIIGHAQAAEHEQRAQAAGYLSHAQASGDHGHAQAAGDYSSAQASGKGGIACAAGRKSKACAGEGGAIVIADWRLISGAPQLVEVYASIVGGTIKGVRIEPNTWYWIEKEEVKSEPFEK